MDRLYYFHNTMPATLILQSIYYKYIFCVWNTKLEIGEITSSNVSLPSKSFSLLVLSNEFKINEKATCRRTNSEQYTRIL